MKYIQKSIYDHMLNWYLEKRIFLRCHHSIKHPIGSLIIFFSIISRSPQWGIKRQITAYDHCAFTCYQLPLGMYQGFQDSRIPEDQGFHEIMDFRISWIPWAPGFHETKYSMTSRILWKKDPMTRVIKDVRWFSCKSESVLSCTRLLWNASFRTITGRDVQAAI